MNWHQLHTLSTPDERLEAVFDMLRVIEARQQRMIFTGRRILRERRAGRRVHFINDRRQNSNLEKTILRMLAAIIVLTTSAAVILITTHIGVSRAVPMILSYEVGLLAMLHIQRLRRLVPA